MLRYIYPLLLGLTMLFSKSILAQNLALGTWQSHLPFSNAVSIAQSANNIYCATEYAVFSYHLNDGSIKRFTKAEGLSDIGVSSVGYDSLTSSLVITYGNSNIDIIRNGKISNLPFVKNAIIMGDKQINRTYCKDGFAYLATGFGVVKIDLLKQEIPAAYFFTDGSSNLICNDVWVNNEYIYASTSQGVVRGKNDAQSNLSNFAEWEKFGLADGIPIQNSSAISGHLDEVFASVGSIVYQFDGNSWSPFYTLPAANATSLFKSKSKLIISQDSRIVFIPNNGSPVIANETFYLRRPRQVIETNSGEIYYADFFMGMIKYESPSQQFPIAPNGPLRINNSQFGHLNGKMFVGSSPIGRTLSPTGNVDGYYTYQNSFWETINGLGNPILEGKTDISVIEPIPSEGLVLMGAHFNSIIEFNPSNNAYKVINTLPNSSSPIRLADAAVDNFGNVWMTNAYSAAPIVCRKAGGDYITFSNTTINNRLITGIAVDDFNQIWIVTDNNGILVFNHGNTLDNTSDDRFLNFTSSNGALPTNSVTSIATDLNGQIWIGTTQGVVYVPCPGAVFDQGCAAAQICIPRKDGTNFCDLLLESELITCILVDAGNRKWFGTTNGLFLQSEDGLESIYYFNDQNSPLLSNFIRNLGVNPENGDLFIGTDKGICTFRADATQTTGNSGKPFAYPNPVRPDYNGPIAVKNLPNNATVKISDSSGKLVFEDKATGGQFIWDGKDRTGQRVSSGVYYVIAFSADNKDKAITKIAFIR